MTAIRLIALRKSLFAATSTSAMLIATSANAQNSGATRMEVPEPTATLQVVPNDTVTPGPSFIIPGSPGSAATNGSKFASSADVLDPVGINGVGQQIAFSQVNPTGGSLGLCTGTLINPRTVITAAHCVYGRPAHQYGSNTGSSGGVNGPFGTLTLTPNGTGGFTASRAVVSTQGVPISFGFKSTNRCLETVAGVNGTTTSGAINGCMAESGPYEKWRNSGFQTVAEEGIYNGNQVWYRRSSQPVASGGGGEFANGDIALVTLDTHAKDVPTWTLLFSPLDGPTHATITGYGGTGVGLAGVGNLTGIDYRRRSAENMIDALMTNHDWRLNAVNSTASVNDQHAIYFMDFDDPRYDPANLPANWFNNTAAPGARNNGYYDFNGLGGTALPLEGTTAGGDSGGPLVVDRRWDKKVIAGVLTGSWSFNGGIATYGSFSVYPPLFPFWEEIVQNNPYKFVSAKAGNGDWMDAAHWVQDMDPNYAVIDANGNLANGVPTHGQFGGDSAGPGGAGDIPVDKFGTLCGVPFVVPTCKTFDGPATNTPWNGTSFVTAGGPGSINFVPNNVEPVNSADAALHRKARYYDVTLREAGTTTLSQAATIDKFTMNGQARLHVQSGGSLNVLTDYTQASGWTQVDGLLKADEMVVATGLLSGSGTIDPEFLTVVGGIVAPGGGDKVGTLTVKGDMIMASASSLFVDARRGSADRLIVVGDAQNAGVLALGGAAVVFNKVTDAPAPRHGESYVIATAAGGVQGTFSNIVYTFQGVLRPELSYGPNSVTALLRAGQLVTILDGQNATAVAFAGALDKLRSTSYNQLYSLYGAVDLMGAEQLSRTLGGLAPRVMGETQSLQDRQSRVLLSSVTDRLSVIGSGQAQGLSIVGAPQGVIGNISALPAARVAQQSFAGLTPAVHAMNRLPKGVTGFLSGGIMSGTSTYGQQANMNDGTRSWHIGMGLETEIASGLTFGTAFGYAQGSSSPEGDRSDSKTTQVAAYGSYQLGGGAYLGAVASAEMARADISRLGNDGVSALQLSGATKSARYNAVAEAGVNLGIGRGLAVTPRAQVGYASYSLDGFREAGGETALQFDDLKLQRLESRFGAKLGGSMKLAGGWAFTPQLSADYVQLLSGSSDGMKVRFAAAPDHRFALPLMGGEASWAEAKGGLKLSNGAIEFGAGFETALGRSSFRDDRAVADFTFRF